MEGILLFELLVPLATSESCNLTEQRWPIPDLRTWRWRRVTATRVVSFDPRQLERTRIVAFFDGKGQFGVALARKLDQGAAFPPRRHDQRCDRRTWTGSDRASRACSNRRRARPSTLLSEVYYRCRLAVVVATAGVAIQVHLPYALLLLGQVLRSLLPKLVPLGLDVDAL